MLKHWLQRRQPKSEEVNGRYRHGNEHLIDLRQVVKTYESAAGVFTALKGVDLQVDPGEFVAVVGKSGSGKSTLINMIAGIDRPTAGQVLVGDTAVHTLNEGQIAQWRGRHLGVVFQFFQLLPTLTVVENVMLPMDFCQMYAAHKREEQAMHLLEQVEMAEHAHKLPTAISGGQQQRVAIARALANDPPVLLADEPTGNLDSYTADSVFQFRRKGRLSLTLLTLTLASAIFIAVFSVRASMLHTLDEALQYWNYDLGVDFKRPERIEQIEREALRVPGVVAAESWGFAGAKRLRPDEIDEQAEEHESRVYFMIAPPAETDMLRPTVLAGRWLLPEDKNAVVINTDLVEEEPDLEVGDELVLEIDERKSTWQVAGLVRTTMSGPRLYTNYTYFAQTVRQVGRAESVQILTAQHDLAATAEVAKALETHFEQIGLPVSYVETIASERQRIETVFNIIVLFLLIMAVLLAVVGGLGLMGTMSINVLERIREIGVIRAIGASDGAVQQIVVAEGVLIGLLSWLIGLVLALPISMLLSNVVGELILQDALTYTFSVSGALLWLGVVLILATLASFLPARSASRLTVREVLAYE